MASQSIRSFTLNTGDQIPAVGLGTWRAQGSAVTTAVSTALRAGYRHIDTALAYGNEREVGEGIRASGIPRDDIWVTTKLRNNWHRHVREGLETSLTNLGLDYVDLYLIHWPCSRDAGNPAVRNIGVSNFGITHLEKLLNSPTTKIVPAVNQIELHPCNPSPKLVAYNTSKGIHTEAYSCLGSAHSPLVGNKTLRGIADAKGKTPQQVLLQWGLQKGWSVVPKSVTPMRIESNLRLDGWELTDDETAALDGIPERYKAVSDGFLPVQVFFGDDE
ncbi:hypothetical protein ACJZ2D_010601 [Fusarium nematophilum]